MFCFQIHRSKFNIVPLYNSAALLLCLPLLQPSTAAVLGHVTHHPYEHAQVTGNSPGYSASHVTEELPNLVELLVSLNYFMENVVADRSRSLMELDGENGVAI